MLSQNDAEFLLAVKEYVRKNPHVGAYVQNSVAEGIKSALDAERQVGVDLETIVIMALSRPLCKAYKKQIADKLSNLSGKLRFKYDSVIEELTKSN